MPREFETPSACHPHQGGAAPPETLWGRSNQLLPKRSITMPLRMGKRRPCEMASLLECSVEGGAGLPQHGWTLPMHSGIWQHTEWHVRHLVMHHPGGVMCISGVTCSAPHQVICTLVSPLTSIPHFQDISGTASHTKPICKKVFTWLKYQDQDRFYFKQIIHICFPPKLQKSSTKHIDRWPLPSSLAKDFMLA